MASDRIFLPTDLGFKDNLVIIGSVWFNGSYTFTVESYDKHSKDRVLFTGGTFSLSLHNTRSDPNPFWRLVSTPDLKPMDKSLGFDKEGKAIVGSKWLFTREPKNGVFLTLPYRPNDKPTEAYFKTSIGIEYGNHWFHENMREDSTWILIGLPNDNIEKAPETKVEASETSDTLPIPKQSTVRHEALEEEARTAEAQGAFGLAKVKSRQARAALAADNAFDSQANAIKEHRYIAKDALKALGTGDRKLYEMKGLQEFTDFGDPEYYWWK